MVARKLCLSSISLTLFLLEVFIVSCNLLPSNNTELPTGEDNYLKVTIYDNPISKNPVSGIIVFINNIVSKELIHSVKTDINGIADFGNVDFEHIDLSYAYEDIDSREIFTFKHLSSGEWTIYIDREDPSLGMPISNINVQVTSIPASYDHTEIQPMYDLSSSLNNGFHNNINVYPDDVQTDGGISIIASAWDGNNNPIKYGLLLDQSLLNGFTYEVPLLLIPSTIQFTTNRPIEQIDVSAIRKGVTYNIGGHFYTQAINSGEIPIFIEFSLSDPKSDIFEISCGYNEELSSTEWKGFVFVDYLTNISSNEVYINIPNFQIDSLTLYPDTREIRWITSGDSSNLDFYMLESSFSSSDNIDAHWDVFINPSESNAYFPELPPEISDWVNLNNKKDIHIVGADYKEFEGLNDFYKFYFTGSFNKEPLLNYYSSYDVFSDS